MALGDTVILDNAAVWVGSGATADTNISGYVAQAMLSFQHLEVPTPHTFGQSGQVTSISAHYTVTVTLDLITDGYDSGELDKIFQDFMPGPLGAGDGIASIVIAHTGASGGSLPVGTAAAPVYTGQIVVSQWDPLGGGQVGQIVRQTRTFTGTGNWTKTTS